MAEDIIEGTHPTRMELLQLKNKLRLAEKGHRLLKEKRDTLLMEFMKLATEASEIGDHTTKQLGKARRAYALASGVAGSNQLMSAAYASSSDVEVEVEHRNVMGLILPQLNLEDRIRQIDERGFGLITTDPSIDVAATEYEKALADMVKLTQTEYSLLALSDEVKKTKRRVNALEYTVIPRLTNTQKYIRMRLEELEREGFYRCKIVKKKRLLK